MSDQSQPNQQQQEKKAAGNRRKQMKQPAGVVVEHKTDGRTRLRVREDLRTSTQMAMIQDQISQHPDVQNVEINERTGSIVMKHAVHRDADDLLEECLEGAEGLAELFLDVPIGEDDDGGGEYARVDRTLADIISRADEWQAKRTHIHGRGALAAGAIAGLGILQMAIYGISLEMLPGPVLLFIAYDIHRRVKLEEKAKEAAAKSETKPEDTGQSREDAQALSAA
jgi:hypothetical protein